MLKELANYSQISLKSKSPSLAVAMQKAKGSMFPFGWYHMLKALKKNDTLDLLLIAIDEEYRNKGVNAMIFDKFAQGITKNGIKYIESTRELEDNTSVQNLWHYLEHTLTKRARTYKKQSINERNLLAVPFERKNPQPKHLPELRIF